MTDGTNRSSNSEVEAYDLLYKAQMVETPT